MTTERTRHPRVGSLRIGPAIHRGNPLLRVIDTPGDLRRLPLNSPDTGALQLRSCLIDTVRQEGGHFAAGLGAVNRREIPRSGASRRAKP